MVSGTQFWNVKLGRLSEQLYLRDWSSGRKSELTKHTWESSVSEQAVHRMRAPGGCCR